jgi:putative peptide zinc metalloprotease protein
MVTLADSLISSSSRRLPLRMRPDLSVRYHKYQGRPYWVIKEPIGLKYYRFQEEEYSILRMLDGDCSFDDIKQRFEREYAPQKISLQDLQHFIGMLHRSGLLVTDAEGQGMQLRKRRDESVRREWMSKLSNILAIRFKGIDPDRLLNWLAPWTNWFFTKWAAMFFGAIALAALLLVGVKFDDFQRRLPTFHEFFGPENWFWLSITLALTKVLHEFGHGLSCKRFGGECHEIGVMILVLTPCLYCNVSDSWLLPNKWHRAVIGAAGMYVEIVLASFATFIWWFSEESSLLNQICLSVMFISSVSTVLFNGNPLLRFDGYYILSDIAEIPNLRQKSSKILQRIMSEWCLGIEQQEDPFLPQGNQWFFALYTIAAVIYRWVVVLSIFLFLNKVLEPYGLKVIGQIIAFSGLLGLVIQPAWQFGKFLHTPGRMHQVKRKNLIATFVVASILIAAFLYVPLPYSVKCALEVQPRNATTVYALEPGTLDELHVEAGQQVKQGDDVARLSNEDLELTVVGLEQSAAVYRDKIRVLEQTRRRPEAAPLWAELPQLRQLLASTEEQLAKAKERLDKLHVKANASGTVMPASVKKAPPGDNGQLPSWSGLALDPENTGAFMQANDELCRIGNPNHFEALLAIDQADINSIHAGQKVRIKLNAFAGQVFETTIESEQDISRKPMPVSPESMSQQAGGALPTTTDATGAARPISATYQVKVPLPEGMHEFKIGQQGRAKISAKPQSLGQRCWRYITRTFHFEL